MGQAEGSGNATLSVSAAAFTEAAARSGQITVSSETLQQVIAVVQSAPVAPAEPSKNSFKAIALGGSFEMEVPKGYTYTVSSSADWITTEPAESILENRHWTGTFTFYFNEFVIPRELDTQDVWVIPGEWVLDAVNCSLADSFYQNPWPAAFDAGWTFCGEYDGDPARLGKSVRRSVNAEGKLVDTNNSTNDFTPNATPSLK